MVRLRAVVLGVRRRLVLAGRLRRRHRCHGVRGCYGAVVVVSGVVGVFGAAIARCATPLLWGRWMPPATTSVDAPHR
eukprot:15436808-Alexandrium_andersonii.AAC.1